MEPNTNQSESQCPPLDIEEIQIKEEPLEILSENEQEMEGR